MSDILYSISKKAERDLYIHGVSKSSVNIDSVTADFIQELLTNIGTSLFDPNYGTTFLLDIGDKVNIHKVRFLLENNYKNTMSKYGIISIEAEEANYFDKNGFLDIKIKAIFESFVSKTTASFPYSGAYTTKTIIEVER